MLRLLYIAALVCTHILCAGDSGVVPDVSTRPQIQRDKVPGRQVRIAAIPIGFGGDHDKKLELALSHLETAGKMGVDIACLPEEFAGTKTAEPIPGPLTEAVSKLAKQYNMWVICPLREQAENAQFNTAVLIDRHGRIAGYYRKVFVVWGEGLNVSTDGVKVFDTDFGRISILTCFDLNFPELWMDAEQKGAEIVFWPSAYPGGAPLNGMAMINAYSIVAVGTGEIIDCTGVTLKDAESPRPKQFVATLDLDRIFIHMDFNDKKVAKLLADHKGEVEMEGDYKREGCYLLHATKPGVHVMDLCKEYQIETLREYRHRSREKINEARKNGTKI